MPLKPEAIRARLTKKFYVDVGRSVDPILRDGNYALKISVDLVANLPGSKEIAKGKDPKEALPPAKDEGSLLPGLPIDISTATLPDLIEIDARDEDLLQYVQKAKVELIVDLTAKAGPAQVLTEAIHAAVDPLGVRAQDEVVIRYDNLAAFRGLRGPMTREQIARLAGQPVKEVPGKESAKDKAATTAAEKADRAGVAGASSSKSADKISSQSAMTNVQRNEGRSTTIINNRTQNITRNEAARIERERNVKRAGKAGEAAAKAAGKASPSPSPLASPGAKLGEKPTIKTTDLGPGAGKIITPKTPELTPPGGTIEAAPPTLPQHAGGTRALDSPVVAAAVLVVGVFFTLAVFLRRWQGLHERIANALEAISAMPKSISEALRMIAKAMPEAIAKLSEQPVIQSPKTQAQPAQEVVVTPQPVASAPVAPEPSSISPTNESVTREPEVSESQMRRDIASNPGALAQILRRKMNGDARAKAEGISILRWLGARRARDVARELSMSEVGQIAASLQEGVRGGINRQLLSEVHREVMSQDFSSTARVELDATLREVLGKMAVGDVSVLIQSFDGSVAATLLGLLDGEHKEGVFALTSAEFRAQVLPLISTGKSVNLVDRAQLVLTSVAKSLLQANRHELLPALVEQAHRYLSDNDLQSLVRLISTGIDKIEPGKLQLIK